MAFEKGRQKTGGRVKGSSPTWKQLCEKHDYTPGELSILSAQGKAPCGTCDGKGKTRFQPGGGKKLTERVCQSCWGSGFERSTLAVKLEADFRNAKRTYPDLKAVEVTGESGGPIQTALTVEFVHAKG